MRPLFLLALFSCSPAAPVAAPEHASPRLPPPIAQANDDRMQCYTPDETKRTCRALASYKLRQGCGIDNTAQVLVAKDPAIVMRVITQVEVKNDQVCGPIRSEDLAIATFTVGNQPADAEQTAKLRQQMQTAMQPILGRETCTSFTPDGRGFRARVITGGESSDDRVIWIAPSDGYIVAP